MSYPRITSISGIPFSDFRFSCQPNCEIKTDVYEDGTFRTRIVTLQPLWYGLDQFTIPFGEESKDSAEPLNCYFHEKNGGDCPLETQRRAHQAEKEKSKK